MTSPLLRAAALFAAISITACGRVAPIAPFAGQTPQNARQVFGASPFQGPILITQDFYTGSLVYWPLSPKGGHSPKLLLKGPFSTNGLAADKGTLVLVNPAPPAEVELVNAYTGHTDKLPDPYGFPLAVAIDKSENIYVVNFTGFGPPPTGNVTEFPAKSHVSMPLVCNAGSATDLVALDNEADVIFDGSDAHGAAGLFEIASGGGCSRLNVRVPNGVAGLYVDPVTDDLLLMDNPGQCAGGVTGRVRIFPKPYNNSIYRTLVLGGSCPSGLWLNADSNVIFTNEAGGEGEVVSIGQYSFPKGLRLGNYRSGLFPIGGIVTIPNSRPN